MNEPKEHLVEYEVREKAKVLQLTLEAALKRGREEVPGTMLHDLIESALGIAQEISDTYIAMKWNRDIAHSPSGRENRTKGF